ncbi:phosphatidylglycerophosphatase A [Acidocella sp. KAb 2-4]|uniref:phosphatidylglycerophosphatase A family protein n=1 Tax=Acidocella sp. KAb 2-4 TaxID=2885158 RepID=UPI001D097A43|nr:phosphatidylglycerophosphatase A [Acidocella sp. KAb 2-4]MCB5944887.1 phosphatidylglycerophosphatase A [Acidocella sp. KAb 2-4]
MKLWTLISSGLGAGYAPKAPGTFGSLVGLALGCALLSLGHLPLLAGIVIATALGLYAVGKLPEANADPKWVVIDEIAGQMIPLLALTGVSLRGVAVAFVLFRLFDILKPGPVAWADQRADEYGIMGDDIIAGLMAWLVILALHLVSLL